MNYKVVANLIFEFEGQDAMGNTITTQHVKNNVRCDLSSNFSINYYANQGNRQLNNSINLITRKENAFDVVIDNNVYQLRRVEYNGLIYMLKNKLEYRENRQMVILDCEEEFTR